MSKEFPEGQVGEKHSTTNKTGPLITAILENKSTLNHSFALHLVP